MTTTLLLIRHGQADTSIQNGPLTEVGRRQALAAARALGGLGVEVVISSPLVRAVQTAEAFGRPFEVVEDLREFDFGPAAWLPAEQQQRNDVPLWRADDGMPGGETIRAFQTRVSGAIEEIVAAHAGRTVAMFMHSGSIDCAIRWAYGLSPEADWVTEVACPNGSITEIVHSHEGGHWTGAARHSVIARIGDARHLEDVTDL